MNSLPYQSHRIERVPSCRDAWFSSMHGADSSLPCTRVPRKANLRIWLCFSRKDCNRISDRLHWDTICKRGEDMRSRRQRRCSGSTLEWRHVGRDSLGWHLFQQIFNVNYAIDSVRKCSPMFYRGVRKITLIHTLYVKITIKTRPLVQYVIFNAWHDSIFSGSIFSPTVSLCVISLPKSCSWQYQQDVSEICL